eukprot:Hpha_TRINITY_DN6752_c0_g2::TRINITY_DN6752_c0_g2_i1::g.110872::m.110872
MDAARRSSIGLPQRRQSFVDPRIMTATEQAVLSEINAARTNPTIYANKVEDELSCVQGTLLFRPGLPHPLPLREGGAPYREVIAELRAMQPLPPLEAAPPGVVRAARDHAADLGTSGRTGHQGADGSMPQHRVNRYGSWKGMIAENLHLGGGTPGRIVVSLLVDDGIPGREHRKNILSRGARLCGVAFAAHSQYDSVCVQVFVGGFDDTETGEKYGRKTDQGSEAVASVASDTRGGPRLVLLDASRLSEQTALQVIANLPGLRVWLREGRRGDEGQDAVRLAALQKARDLGALSDDAFRAAAARLLPAEATEEQRDGYAKLAACFAAGALSHSEYREAVARLHLGVEVELGGRCEVRLAATSPWQPARVTAMDTDSGRLVISAALEGSVHAQEWPHIRPAVAPPRLEILREKLDEKIAERDAMRAEVDSLVTHGVALGEPKALAALEPSIQGSSYEMFGFAFDVRSTRSVAVTAVTFYSKVCGPARVKVYRSLGGLREARRSPSLWQGVSAPLLLRGFEAPNEPLTIPLTSEVPIAAGGCVGLMLHSEDDQQSVCYERQPCDPVASDGVVSIHGGAAVQRDMTVGGVVKLLMGFALVGAIEYSETTVRGGGGDGVASPDVGSPDVGSPEDAVSPSTCDELPSEP